MRRWLLILFSFSVFCASSQQTNYSFWHLDQTDGLLHNTVRSITQDANGYIWIGTNNGLQRYDGLRFVNYQGRLNNSNTDLINVQNVFADDPVLWFSADTETVKLELSKNKFSIYSPDQKSTDSLLHNQAYTDEQNQKWIVSDFGIYKYDAATKKMVLYFKEPPYYPKMPALHGTISKTIVEDRNHHQIWAVGYDQLFLFDSKTKKLYNNNTIPFMILYWIL